MRVIVQVYAVIAVMFAGWTMTAFLWKLSAWLLLLNLGEIFTVFSYAMAANFVESLLTLLILLTACVLLPAPYLRDDFGVRGTLLAIGLIGALMSFVGSHMLFGIQSGLMLLLGPLIVLLLTGFLLRLSGRRERLRSIASSLSDRAVVFLFLLVPLFGILSIYVLLRNLV